MKVYQGPNNHEPGKTFPHYGTSRDHFPAGPFGRDTRPDPAFNMGEVIRQLPHSEVAQFHMARGEQIYASTKREPVGKAASRDYVLPEGLGSEIPFGMTSGALPGSIQVQQALSGMDERETVANATMYKKSHRHYAPGEQRTRGYQWDSVGVDPTSSVFGRPSAVHDPTTIANVLMHQINPGVPSGDSTIVPAVLADHKALAGQDLGKARPLGFGDRPALDGRAAGVPSIGVKGKTEPSVEELLKTGAGDPTEVDADLGRSLLPGTRNMTRPGDEERTFGVPTIRRDIPEPKVPSLANEFNFGRDPDAGAVIFPSRGAEAGVTDDMVHEKYDYEALVDLVASAGVAADDRAVRAAFELASDGTGKASVASFFRAKAHVDARMNGL